MNTTFAQVQHAAEEWLSEREVFDYTAELLAMYAHGIPIEKAASIVASLANEKRWEQADRGEL